MIFLLSAIRTNSLKSGFKDGIPRLCGEKQFGAPNPDVTQGSPPPMRGKAKMFTPALILSRITPAYAGKRTAGKSAAVLCRDHPRLCGEKLLKPWRRCCVSGSPPPMRGKGTQILWNCFFDQDHPRLCGEKTLSRRRIPRRSGSPPPMREKGTVETGI